jgi:hypothetical protein
MANNGWFNQNSGQSDPSTFNYDTASTQAKRMRDQANAIQALGATPLQGQVIQSPMGTFYAGGNTAGSTIGRLAETALGLFGQSKADDAQSQLNSDSNAALQYQLDPSNSIAAQAASAQQSAKEAQASADREAQNMSTQAGQMVGGQTMDASELGSSDGPQPIRQDGQTTITPLPPVAARAAQVLGGGSQLDPGAVSSKSAAQALAGRAFDSGTGNGWDAGNDTPAEPMLDPMTGLPIGGMLSQAPQMPQQAPQVAPGASSGPQPTPAQLPPPSAQTTSAPAGGSGATFMPQNPDGSFPAPGPAAPQPPQPPVPTPQMSPQEAQEVAMAQARMQAGLPANANPNAALSDAQQAGLNAQPTQEQKIGQLMKIAQTGPMGQQMAQGQLQQMYASKNGRFTTDVKPDPVNGGFVAVTTDSQTGQIKNIVPIGMSGSTLVTGQTTDAIGRRWNMHKDGSVSPLNDPSGKQIVDPTVVNANNDNATKVAANSASVQGAISGLQGQLNSLDRMDALYDKTSTGPIAGTLPAWTDNRQELQSLAGSNAFAGVREAVDGVGGGSQKFTQGELSHFSGGNGGLSLDTSPPVAHNIIAQQRAVLTAKLQAFQAQQSQSPQAPGAAPQGGVPGYGVSTIASAHGF